MELISEITLAIRSVMCSGGVGVLVTMLVLLLVVSEGCRLVLSSVEKWVATVVVNQIAILILVVNCLSSDRRWMVRFSSGLPQEG